MPSVATIGVYGFTLAVFIDSLHRAQVRLLLDVRQRRGVRGSEYAWANSKRLQAALAAAGIAALVAQQGASALLCVERDPEACHRSLVAERLAAEHGVSVIHLRP